MYYRNKFVFFLLVQIKRVFSCIILDIYQRSASKRETRTCLLHYFF